MASTNDHNYTDHPDYERLPEAIKAYISPKEYAWMSDEERRNLQEDMTMPEPQED